MSGLEQSELEEIARLKQGDIGGLETLVRLYQVKAVRAAFLITRDRALAEDIVQAAFIRAYERIEQFEAGRSFGPWFLKSVANDALKAVTRREKGVSLEQTFEVAGQEEELTIEARLTDNRPGPEELLEQTETRLAISAALNHLAPAQRAAIVLRYYLDLPEAEIAEQLGCPPGTLKWRLHAARQRLQELLEGLRPNTQNKKKDKLEAQGQEGR